MLRQPVDRNQSVKCIPKEIVAEVPLPFILPEVNSVTSAKKKRRKSDKHAGLKLPPSHLLNHTAPSLKTNVMVATPKLNPGLALTERKTVTPVAKVKQQPQHLQQKGGKTKKQPPKQISASAQMTADLKHRNNIMLLANALKMNSNSSASPLRGLQSMLRK